MGWGENAKKCIFPLPIIDDDDISPLKHARARAHPYHQIKILSKKRQTHKAKSDFSLFCCFLIVLLTDEMSWLSLSFANYYFIITKLTTHEYDKNIDKTWSNRKLPFLFLQILLPTSLSSRRWECQKPSLESHEKFTGYCAYLSRFGWQWCQKKHTIQNLPSTPKSGFNASGRRWF